MKTIKEKVRHITIDFRSRIDVNEKQTDKDCIAAYQEKVHKSFIHETNVNNLKINNFKRIINFDNKFMINKYGQTED